MLPSHTPLFHPRVVREQLARHAFPADLEARHAILRPWVEALRAGKIDATKESSLHGEFLQRVFGDVLGYRGVAQSGGTNAGWDLVAEKTVSARGKSADGAIGFFRHGHEPQVIAPIELKGAKQSLDHALSRALTPVQQAWDYANHCPGCRYVIVSNYRETRLYSTARTPEAFELFLLDDLLSADAFRRFYLLLGRNSLLPRSVQDASLLDDLLKASAQVEAQITDALYAEYRALRKDLYAHLCRAHSNIPATLLLRHAQTILDRVLFIAFAEDRGLLPANTIADACAHRDRYQPRPIWHNFLAVFRWIDEGNAGARVPAYNGGLFQQNVEIDELELSDALCERFKDLARYDFRDDVSVEVLGHIFEQSITDLEALRAQATRSTEAPKISRRKQEGVFYTPSYITRFIVEETLGRVLTEKWEAALLQHQPDQVKAKAKREQAWVATWETYRDVLKETRVLDPACGSGAFLIAAFDTLAREYERVNAALAALRGGQAGLFDLTATILNNNLFGVDLNLESVEISKLSLWLKTAAQGHKLTYLDRNIKCGNSIIADSVLDARAFNWAEGNLAMSFIAPPTSDTDAAIDARWREGFDVVIGNPPYVRQELLAPYKGHLEEQYECYHGVADLYLYFYELGLRLLRSGGRLGFISSGTFARANFARSFRTFLPTQGQLETLIDFGENQPFADAEMVRPSIMVVKKAPSAPTFRYLFLAEKIPASLPQALQDSGVACSAAVLSRPEWTFQSDAAASLTDKLLARGAPLSQVSGGRMYYGIKTGLNEAFLVDQATHDALLKADPSCAPLLKKMLRGEDLRPWYQEDEGRWLIGIPCGWTAQTSREGSGTGRGSAPLDDRAGFAHLQRRHPAIAAHLERFAEAGQRRQDQGEFWWELRPCTYDAAFAEPKIFWPDIAKLPRFSFDTEGKFINNKGYILPTNDRALLAVLQSRVTWFVVSKLCTPLRLRAGLWQYQMFSQFTERLPIPEMPPGDREALAQLATRITELARARYALHRKTRERVISDLVPADQALNRKLTDWWRLDFRSLRTALSAAFKQDIPLRERDAWEDLWRERRAEHERITAEMVLGERELNERIYRLFDLTLEEIRLIEDETKFNYGEV